MGRKKQKLEETERNWQKQEKARTKKSTKKSKRQEKNKTKQTRMYTSLRCNTTLKRHFK